MTCSLESWEPADKLVLEGRTALQPENISLVNPSDGKAEGGAQDCSSCSGFCCFPLPWRVKVCRWGADDDHRWDGASGFMFYIRLIIMASCPTDAQTVLDPWVTWSHPSWLFYRFLTLWLVRWQTETESKVSFWHTGKEWNWFPAAHFCFVLFCLVWFGLVFWSYMNSFEFPWLIPCTLLSYCFSDKLSQLFKWDGNGRWVGLSGIRNGSYDFITI